MYKTYTLLLARKL